MMGIGRWGGDIEAVMWRDVDVWEGLDLDVTYLAFFVEWVADTLKNDSVMNMIQLEI